MPYAWPLQLGALAVALAGIGAASPWIEARQPESAAPSAASSSEGFKHINAIRSPKTVLLQPSNDGIPIQRGYVAFGDSFAAGIGTGYTEFGLCKKGSNSYPKQLRALGPPGLDFQELSCSSDTVQNVLKGGKNSQIDKWTNPGNTDLATITIGGNDIGFYDVLTACVIRVGGIFAGNCQKAIDKANGNIQNPQLLHDISDAFTQIIEKANQPSFRIFNVGYPDFFNQDTHTCDTTSFEIFDEGHDETHHWWRTYLDSDKRTKLNGLVNNLNRLLSLVAQNVNAKFPTTGLPVVTFIDPNPKFDGHRWCEVDNGVEVVEPDPNRLDTWFFLSGWKDNNLPGSNSAADAQSEEDAETAKGNSTALPNPATCNQTVAIGDWGARMLCDIAIAITNTTDTPYKTVVADQKLVAQGQAPLAKVPWWSNTRLIKTFHPRTLGQMAFKDAVTDVWNAPPVAAPSTPQTSKKLKRGRRLS